jgi:hypothetical protein
MAGAMLQYIPGSISARISLGIQRIDKISFVFLNLSIELFFGLF